MRQHPALPPLSTLRVFECVGRLQSFRAAGEELCISQSAVSYHVKALEIAVGVRLFEREARSIRFTAEGAAYHKEVVRTFQLLADATASLRPEPSKVLRVSVLPSFAVGWLVQRLPAFCASHPEIELRLQPSLDLADLENGEVDLAIRYGRGDWDSVHSEQLMPERLRPVASPQLALARQEWSPADIAAATLLQVSRPYEWDLWAERFGVDLSAATKLQLTDFNIAAQAAVEGMGIVMGRESLVEGRMRSGALVPLGPDWFVPPRLGYWLCLPERPPQPQCSRFVAWLRRQTHG
ncbi:hypothetical protein CHU94_17755 [Rhodoferax sp. TH121]|uniref:LysR substrate-binding domain-containing protein n=1 Tax=Rhodoferax sp. TH121 TaxID=2022803 RepID=UPI000B96D9EE|nr:LysR substrate-binding domain-containing protein [Rhodoferax sp. TH121]OYQ39237.1 hypothetical protein CHU94_17755 [Rhodoferax sp. TH121]